MSRVYDSIGIDLISIKSGPPGPGYIVYMTESRLEMAERHVREGRRIVQRHRQVLAQKRARGEDTADTEALLATFERTLALFEDDLASLRKTEAI